MPAATIKVLCVDDSPKLAAALEKLISAEADMQSVGAIRQADELVPAVKTRAADVVLLDLTMPGRDPLDALQELTTECPAVRVIVFSGTGDSELAQRAIEAGAWGYTAKGSDAANILSAIRTVAKGEMAVDLRSGL
jgi:DNA-binding NarL/FixJ family response regulator